jgi:hypothetical protein
MAVVESNELNGVELEHIRGWEELARLLKEIASTEQASVRQWLFRGESWEPGREESIELLSKAGRVSDDQSATRKVAYTRSHEIAALDMFKKQARPHLRHQPQNDLEWLAVAEHHGMATRLLDWTQSLLVATYFATKYAGERDRYGLIFGVPDLPLVEPRDEEQPFALKEVKVYRPPHISSRIPAQRSVFTVHPNPTEPFRPAGLRAWKIEQDACGEIKRVLEASGINEAALFPDLDGLSRYIGWLYKWGQF